MSRANKRILIVTPAPKGSNKGNRVTANRWARILKSIGYSVSIAQSFDGQDVDLLVALHAKYSARSIQLFKRTYPERPLVLAMTGTDLYRDLQKERSKEVVKNSLRAATRVIVLHPAAIRELPAFARQKTRVIYQSLPKQNEKSRWSSGDHFKVCVVGHLRTVKDPFRAAMAARNLPSTSKLRVVHIGAALTQAMKARAERESTINARYTWIGELSRSKTLQHISKSQLLVLSSKMEGGANVISEAIVCGVPVIASRISGSVGLLGADYPGLYPVGDTDSLRKLLLRAESDVRFYNRLTKDCAKLRSLFDPKTEEASWRTLLNELSLA